MAVSIRELFPLQQAKNRRSRLPRYLQLDGGRYLIAAALFLSLISLISLGQTGRLATKGYEIAQLQTQKINLLREHSALQLELSEAQSLAKIEQQARELHLRPMTPDQAQYVTIAPPSAENPEPRAEPTEDLKP
jgi:cell division protein FtsL